MAADSRERIINSSPDKDVPPSAVNPSASSLKTSSPTSTERPDQGKIFETFTPSSSPAIAPPENANALPGGTMNTAGGRPKQATVFDAIKAIKLEDFTKVHQLPCVRDALLFGIGSGFTLGGGRLIFGGTYSSLRPYPSRLNRSPSRHS
jgi:cytochrome c oxidase assembly protein subunit 20